MIIEIRYHTDIEFREKHLAIRRDRYRKMVLQKQGKQFVRTQEFDNIMMKINSRVKI